MPHVSFDPAAEAELIDAMVWYESEQEGLGRRFLIQVRELTERIGVMPAAFPAVEGPRRKPPIRRALVDGFPYAIVFIARKDQVRVLAIAHGKRHPNYWLKRTRKK